VKKAGISIEGIKKFGLKTKKYLGSFLPFATVFWQINLMPK